MEYTRVDPIGLRPSPTYFNSFGATSAALSICILYLAIHLPTEDHNQ